MDCPRSASGQMAAGNDRSVHAMQAESGRTRDSDPGTSGGLSGRLDPGGSFGGCIVEVQRPLQTATQEPCGNDPGECAPVTTDSYPALGGTMRYVCFAHVSHGSHLRSIW